VLQREWIAVRSLKIIIKVNSKTKRPKERTKKKRILPPKTHKLTRQEIFRKTPKVTQTGAQAWRNYTILPVEILVFYVKS
jgi:hypothetical protein